jgi:hypothetical protein
MAQPDRNSQRDNKRNNEPNFNWRGIVLIAIAFGLIGMALLVRNGGYQNVEDVPYNRFIELLDNKQIISDKNLPVTLLVQEGQPTRALIGYYRKQTAGAEQAMKFRTTVDLNFSPDLEKRLSAAGNRTCSPRPFSVFSRSRSSSSFSISCSASKSVWPVKAPSTSASPKRACWLATKTRSLSAT